MATLERAIAIAAEAHAGQVDKGGSPYILHPLRVMMAVSTPFERCAAILHDVVEDCPDWPLDRLRAEGFPDHVILALDALTRRGGETYGAFIDRIAADHVATAVKLADLDDNMDTRRLRRPLTDADIARIRKYERAVDRLTKATTSSA